jgi:hypothetical protein
LTQRQKQDARDGNMRMKASDGFSPIDAIIDTPIMVILMMNGRRRNNKMFGVDPTKRNIERKRNILLPPPFFAKKGMKHTQLV